MAIVAYIFWISFLLLAHTYVLYPLLLRYFSKNKKQNSIIYSVEELPTISILLAVYNEEIVIREKIESTFKTNYPLDKIEFLIGSDASTDATEQLIQSFQVDYPQLQLRVFKGRTGKPQIINKLAEEAKNEVFVITDANVFFSDNTLFHLVKHFKNSSIGLVGGNIVNYNIKNDGISHQERSYLKGENLVKYMEGIQWGSMIGTFGGIYAVKKSVFEPVPATFLVDDFYISMAVLEQQQKAILELKAIAYEDVSNQLQEEFRRKSRISRGNFQNLVRFRSFLIKPWKGESFAYISHKVLRWIGPFFLLFMLACSAVLAQSKLIYLLAFLGEISFLLLPFVDSCLKLMKVNFGPLRFVSHFVWMNIALMNGFFQFIAGVKSNIWTPTQRYQ